MTGPDSKRRAQHAFVVIAVLVIALLGYRLAQSHDEPRPAPATSTTATPAPVEQVTWPSVAGVKVPASSLHGPRCVDGRLAACFDSTDAGSGLAAANILIRSFPFSGPATFIPTIAYQIAGTDQPNLARLTDDAYQRAAKTAGVKDGAPLRAEGGQVSGYRIIEPFDGPTDGERNVGVLVGQASPEIDGAFVEYVVHLTWVDGDWVMTAPPWGDWRLAARDVGDPQTRDWQPFDHTVDHTVDQAIDQAVSR